MELKRFDKNSKQKKTFIIVVIVAVLLVTSIVLYNTFALYEHKKEFNVLKGTVPPFSKGFTSFEDMKTLASEDENVCGKYGLVQVSHKDANIASLSEYGDANAQKIATDNLKQTEYRYCGEDPNNYVTFNGEIAGWRIIGLVNTPEGQRIKLIRAASIGNYSWDNKPNGTGSSISNMGSNEWGDSALMNVLNFGAYYNQEEAGTCPKCSTTDPYCATTPNTTTCNNYSPNSTSEDRILGLSTEAKTMIDTNVTWNLGGTDNTYATTNAINFYNNERGNTAYNSSRLRIWKGNGVGLMYPSDYGYATGGGNLGRTSCLEKELYNWNTEDYQAQCAETDWLRDPISNLWAISSRSGNAAAVFGVGSTGSAYGIYTYDSKDVRPVVYLKTNIEIAGGSGTTKDPYTLKTLALKDFEDMETLASSDENICPASGIVQVSHSDANIASLSEYGDVNAQKIATDNLKQTEYRYCGNNPNNYVTFNGETAGWRIIGLVNTPEGQRIKLIRSQKIDDIAWDNMDEGIWKISSLHTYLNGSYKTNMTNDKNMIDTVVTWNLGGTQSYEDPINGLASHFYNYERGDVTYVNRSKTWQGNGIGLMYPSDYGYATGGGTIGRTDCLGKELNNWNSEDYYSQCVGTNWLNSGTRWTLTPYTMYDDTVFFVDSDSRVSDASASFSFGVMPVVYLKSNIEIAGGSGTTKDPYTLE